MFYRQHKTLWYQFCNFKHFRKAENSEDSLASSCAVLLVCHVTQYETGLLLELGFRVNYDICENVKFGAISRKFDILSITA